MSELLCGSCPMFAACSDPDLEDEIPDLACWNWLHDHGQPLYQSPPMPRGVPAEPQKKTVTAKRVRVAREPRPAPVKGPRPAPLRDDLVRLKAEMQRTYKQVSINTALSILRRIPEPYLVDLAITPEQIGVWVGIKHAHQHILTYRRLVLKAERQERPQPPRGMGTYRKAITTRTERFNAKHFNGRTPPLPISALASRPDLWTYAERVLARDPAPAQKTAITTISSLSRYSADDLANPDMRPETIVARQHPNAGRSYALRQIGRIREYRRDMGIRVTPETNLKYSAEEKAILIAAPTPDDAVEAYRREFPGAQRAIRGIILAWEKQHRRAQRVLKESRGVTA